MLIPEQNIPLMINWVLKSLILTGMMWETLGKYMSLYCLFAVSLSSSSIVVSVLKQRESVMKVKHRVSRQDCGAVMRLWSAFAWICIPVIDMKSLQSSRPQTADSRLSGLVWGRSVARFRACERVSWCCEHRLQADRAPLHKDSVSN